MKDQCQGLCTFCLVLALGKKIYSIFPTLSSNPRRLYFFSLSIFRNTNWPNAGEYCLLLHLNVFVQKFHRKTIVFAASIHSTVAINCIGKSWQPNESCKPRILLKKPCTLSRG